MSNIRNAQSFMDSMWDFSFLNDCFGDTKIRITDIDGAVERNGHVLFIETKRPGVPIPRGQSIMYTNLLTTGLFSLIGIWGEANRPEYMRIWKYNGKIVTCPSCSLALIHDWVEAWYHYADRQPRPMISLDRLVTAP